jgi:6-phosphogluconolactonase/glucosamine-6-phosphate isomerase/deaminase
MHYLYYRRLGMPKTETGEPRFDLILLGMGSDGHVGSLYPKKLSARSPLILPVLKGEGAPSSITFSLALMNAGSKVVVSLTGASKAAAVKQVRTLDNVSLSLGFLHYTTSAICISFLFWYKSKVF